MAVSSLRPDSAPGDSATLNLTRSHPLVTRTPTWEIVAKRRKHRIIGDNEDVKKFRCLCMLMNCLGFDTFGALKTGFSRVRIHVIGP